MARLYGRRSGRWSLLREAALHNAGDGPLIAERSAAPIGERDVILADEPTGALDSTTGEAVLAVLRKQCDRGAAGLLVTHEARHAAWADRVIFLRDGRVVDTTGSPQGADSLLVQVD